MLDYAAKDTTDLERLQKLNRDYIRSVQESDTARFGQILAEDFLNSNPDGTLVDRAGFLAQIAPPASISNLPAHDVRIRLMGDFAIIHARTKYTKPDGQAAAGATPISGHAATATGFAWRHT